MTPEITDKTLRKKVSIQLETVDDLVNNKKFEAASKILKKLIKEYGENVKLIELLAEISYQNDCFEDVIIYYSKLITLGNKIDPYYYFARGYANLQLKHNMLAIADFEKALSMRYQPVKCKINLSTCLKQIGNLNAAIKILTDLIDEGERDFDIYLNLAVLHYESHNLAKAIEAYTEAEKINSKKISAHYFNIALCFRDSNEYAKAAIYCAKAIPHTKEPNRLASIYFDLAIFHEQLGHYELAINYILSCIKLKADAVSYNNLAYLYNKTQKFDEAIAACKSALDIDANYEQAKVNLQIAETAKHLKLLADYSNDVISLTELIKNNTTNANYYYERGKCLYELGLYTESLQDFNQAIELGDFSYHDKALAHLKLNQYPEALNCYNKLIEGLQTKGFIVDPTYYQERNNIYLLLQNHANGQELIDNKKILANDNKVLLSQKPIYDSFYKIKAQVPIWRNVRQQAIESIKEKVTTTPQCKQ